MEDTEDWDADESEIPEAWRHPSWPYPLPGTRVKHLFKDDNNNVYLYNPSPHSYYKIGIYCPHTDSIALNGKYKKI